MVVGTLDQSIQAFQKFYFDSKINLPLMLLPLILLNEPEPSLINYFRTIDCDFVGFDFKEIRFFPVGPSVSKFIVHTINKTSNNLCTVHTSELLFEIEAGSLSKATVE